jgi:hypothetical protein
LDSFGNETGGGEYNAADDYYAHQRVYAYRKPVSWLDASLSREALSRPDDLTRKGFERCLAWGVYLGTTDFTYSGSEYGGAENAAEKAGDRIEKLRPAYREFTPLIKEVATAGWEPLTLAMISNPKLNVERFGDLCREERLYFTVYNPLNAPVRQATLKLDAGSLGLPPDPKEMKVEDVRSGKSLDVLVKNGSWHIRMPEIGHEKTVVVRVCTQDARRKLRLEILREHVKRIVQTMEWLKAYPRGKDDAAKAGIAKEAGVFLSGSPAEKLIERIGTCIDTGSLPDKHLARKNLDSIISRLKRLPADPYREAMLNQARLAIKELQSI